MPNPTTGQPAAGDPPTDPATTPTTTLPGTAPAATGEPAAGQSAAKKDDEPLGETGLRALQAERDARKALEEQVKALAPLQKIAEALGVDADPTKSKSQVDEIAERLASHEKDLADERAMRFRAEVANDFKFTKEQAAELVGTTREELVAHAERLKKLFPAPDPAAQTWGPSDGGSRGTTPPDLAQQIQDAQAKGDWPLAKALKAQRLAASKPSN